MATVADGGRPRGGSVGGGGQVAGPRVSRNEGRRVCQRRGVQCFSGKREWDTMETISVTQKNIDDATSWANSVSWSGVGVSSNCPVARALKEGLGCSYARVGLKTFTVIWGVPGRSATVRHGALPEVVRRAVSDFDNRKALSPFSFEI